ncbi:uncharacterized protein METZ01_LOCUS98703 [marine metagenome]|uniref:histidine--tRNA ligase n=1 Tax=marine metagenome TaxID=408172 RepID=A0A381VZW2_9ZZZZ
MDKSLKLSGTEDITGNAWTMLKWVQKALYDVFATHGYRFIDTPMLEPTDLFVRKGGGEIITQMYSFSTPDGRHISIRPEFTSSIVRQYIESNPPPPVPSRLQYSGPVFRYDIETRDNRQFHQSGVELIGSDHLRSDSEVLSLSCLGLSTLGLEKTRLVITDLHIFSQILDHYGLSDREKLFVMNHIRILQKGDEARLHVKEKARIFSLPQPDSPPIIDLVDVTSMSKTKARQLIVEMLKKDDMGFLGRRTADQITARLLRKISGNYDSSKMNTAIEIVGTLAMIAGDPQDCLRAAKEIIKKHGLSSISLENLEQALSLLSSGNIGDTSVVVDFGLARGISYYTGIIFELTDATGATSFGGGGRYDGLANSLGSKRKLPALGFAYNLEHLIGYIKETMQPTDIRGDTTRNTLVLPLNSASYEKALEVAKDLRANQNNVEIDVCMRDLKESMAYALSNNIDVIVTVGESGVEKEYNVV